ncbi:MAG: hypothetical protein ACYCXP_07485 [Leptospirillum sp.]|jgi:hypothetical protein
MTRAINIVIPDAGPLISLAKGGHLDLLFFFKPEVRILIADAVAHEVTRFAGKHPDAAVIAGFIAKNAPRVQVEKTELGATLIAAMQLWDTYQSAPPEKKSILENAVGLKPENPPRNGGEAAILGLAREMTYAHKENVILVLSEDRRFLSAAIGLTQTHVLSTRAFLEGLSRLGKISLDEIWSDIVTNRAGVNSDSVDEPAPDEETDWHSSISEF